MKYDVKAIDPSRCEAEGKHRGYVVRVYGQTDIQTDRWRMAVGLHKLGEYGQAPTTGHKFDATKLSAGSADEIFQLGFDLAERKIDSYTKAD